MNTPLLFLLLGTVLGFLHSCRATNTSPQLNDDVLGLIVFKSGLEDPSSALNSWNEDDDSPCSWKFILCDPLNGRVSEVTLDGLRLSGKISRGLEKLQNLQVLSLSHNNFSGEISPDLALIDSLKRLNLSHNGFSGTIPVGFGNMGSIRILDFSENRLSGPIPDHLFENCSSLRSVSLGGNLFEGTIPQTLPKCMFLGDLNLSDNHLVGTPDFVNGIWLMKRLRILDLSFNGLSGPVPEGVVSLHNIKQIYLQKNQFSEALPSDIGLCPHLNHLDFSSNFFTGSLPDSFQKLSSLTFINLSKNQLIGNFPSWIGNMSSLQYFDFSRNRFTGNLPNSLGDLKQLKSLRLSDNQISGEIPKSLVFCTGISELNLGGNILSGSIPEDLFRLGLEELDLSSNRLTGSIPSGSTQIFESLQLLDLSRNNLTGKIPAEMGLYFNLRYLNLSWNNLQSSLPPELGDFKYLSELDLRYSGLYGSIPGDLCDSNSLILLQLDGNLLSGPIPEEIGNCSSIYYLSLSHNSLNGTIPEELSRLKNLEILNLAFNNLSGEIPAQLGSLDNLLAVNISYNRLVGRLPMGSIFQNLDQSALEGNLGLCSPILKTPCKMNVPKPLVLNPDAYRSGNGNLASESSSDKLRHRKFLSVSALIAISAAAFIAVGVAVVSFLNVSATRKLAFVNTNAIESFCSSSPDSGPAMGKLVLFRSSSDSRSEDWVNNAQSLLKKASEIGKGVFGTVYKATVGEGRAVAIKKLVTSNLIQSQEDFDREVQILGKARHPNLICLKAYYWTPQLQLLISEYAINGSLYSKLHERSPSSPPLSWANRFKIALGTAKGLAHLHHSFRPPIIHYNIKTSNILLDENYTPKISDYGLARLLPKLDKHILSSRFQSALGYVAPELACQSLRINEKCDIYGFGVLILELVTGKRPVEYSDDDVTILKDHVRVLLEHGNVLECVDPSMSAFPEDEVLPVLKLGLVCTSQIPSSRPSMAEIVQILQVIKTPIPHRIEAF